MLDVERVRPRVTTPLVGELPNFHEEMRQLINRARRVFPFAQHSSRTRKRNVDRPPTALCGADAEERGLGQNGSIGQISPQPAREGSVHAAELLIHHRLENEVARQPQMQGIRRLRHEQVDGYAGFHVVRAASVQAIAFDLAAKSIPGPRLGTAGHGIYVPGQDQRTATSGAFPAGADIGPAVVLTIPKIKRMVFESGDRGQFVDIRHPSCAAQNRRYISLALGFVSGRRPVLGRNPDEILDQTDEAILMALDVL